MTAEAATPTVSGEESYVSKLTIKTLGCNPSMVKTLPDGENKLAICRLYGKVQDVKYQENKDKGEVYTFFAGTFEGINMQNGEVLRSGKLFLPKGISEVVESEVKNLRAKDDKASVSFAFEIRAVKATNPIGYSYEAAALKKPEAEDELSELRSAISKFPTLAQKQLTTAKGGQAALPTGAKKAS